MAPSTRGGQWKQASLEMSGAHTALLMDDLVMDDLVMDDFLVMDSFPHDGLRLCARTLRKTRLMKQLATITG